MRKLYVTVLSGVISLASLAQVSTPNGNFEQWNTATYEMPQNYMQTSNPETFYRTNAAFNCVKVADPFHGSFAMKLTTVAGTAGGDTTMGYCLNANPNNGSPCQWNGGMPYNQKPTGLRGHYKCNVPAGDSAGVLVAFKNKGSCLGFYMIHFYGVHSTYTTFNLNFTTPLTGTPDTMIFAAISSDVFDDIQKAGSMLQIDSLTFTGGVAQPALFNGDFENWQTKSLDKPVSWLMQTNDQGGEILKTTDAAKGQYAVELKTILGDRNNKPAASASSVSTGWYDCPKGGGMCIQKGGFPYTKQIDTLAFYYKFTPGKAGDSAGVYVNFKKNGVQTWGTNKNLGASASYKYVEIPFNIGSAPDSVIVQLQSTLWEDTLVTSVGADLKIDEVHFKSQPLNTGIQNFAGASTVKVFPNPSSDGVFNIENINASDIVKVFNVIGEEINAVCVKQSGYTTIKINSAGVYFLQVNSKGNLFTERVIVSH